MIKQKVKHFFLETKAGQLFMKSLAVLNTAEGIIHLVVAGIGAWGLIATSTYDIRTWIPIYENFAFGVFSILTGWALGASHH